MRDIAEQRIDFRSTHPQSHAKEDAARVLIAGNDHSMAILLSYNLQLQGHVTAVVPGAAPALERIAEFRPDVIFIDTKLADCLGFELCRLLREIKPTQNIPIFLFYDASVGFDPPDAASAPTAYLPKPYSVVEILALVARVAVPKQTASEQIACGDIVIDLIAHRVRWSGHPVHVSPVDFQILCLLAANPHRVFSREQILKAVWAPDASIDVRTIDAHIRQLRKALKQPDDRFPIRTVLGVGYSLES